MKRCVVIYNPNSGREKSMEILKDVEKMLKENNYEVDIKCTEYKGHAIEIMQNLDECDLAIAAGGDGTFNEVITGNMKRSKKLLISHLPIGTTNDVGTMYGYGKNYLANLKLLLNGTVKKADVLLINGKPYIYVAGYGNFIDIAYSTPRKLKKKYGRFGYFIHALKTIPGRLKFFNIKYEIDGVEHSGKYSFIFITNSTRVAGVQGIYSDVKLDDKKFEVLFCNVRSKTVIIKDLLLIRSKDIVDLKGFEYYKTDNLKIEFIDNLKSSWCLDGEEYLSVDKNFVFSVTNELEILLPNKNIEKLFIN